MDKARARTLGCCRKPACIGSHTPYARAKAPCTPVEFVPYFARLVPFVDCGEEGAALNLRRIADGLLELLEHFEPAKPRAVVVRLQDSLLRQVRRLIREELSGL